MNLPNLVSRVRILIDDLKGEKYPDTFIQDMINEGLRDLCRKTLILEDTDTSLTYSSTYDGFGLPTDCIKIKKLMWTDSHGNYVPIPAHNLDYIYDMRNQWIDISASEADALNPMGYALHERYIILDSTTQTSPRLYYYKYDTALSGTTSPTIDSEYHRFLIDYAVFNINPDDARAMSRYNYGIRTILGEKEKSDSIRSEYQAL
jgi:hypothetical protein